ncbi:MAG: acyltransferase [Sandaracinus sp.]|nr:acyltransferase [Sandaracinus sp.]
MSFQPTAGSTLSIGNGVIFNSISSRNTLIAGGECSVKLLSRDATLRIGNHTGITSAAISVAANVAIGDRVLIGAGVIVTDSDHHFVDIEPMQRRHAGFPAAADRDSVTIGNDAFIGARSIILKGADIGSGSVVGAGSVVASAIPPNVVAAGNPCRVIRKLRLGDLS